MPINQSFIVNKIQNNLNLDLDDYVFIPPPTLQSKIKLLPTRNPFRSLYPLQSKQEINTIVIVPIILIILE